MSKLIRDPYGAKLYGNRFLGLVVNQLDRRAAFALSVRDLPLPRGSDRAEVMVYSFFQPLLRGHLEQLENSAAAQRTGEVNAWGLADR